MYQICRFGGGLFRAVCFRIGFVEIWRGMDYRICGAARQNFGAHCERSFFRVLHVGQLFCLRFLFKIVLVFAFFRNVPIFQSAGTLKIHHRITQTLFVPRFCKGLLEV